MGTSSVLTIILAVFLVLWGAWTIYKGVRATKRANETNDWPATSGRITRIEVVSRISTKRSGGNTTRTVRYEPVVTYEYTIGGSAYTGVKIQENPKTFLLKSKADEVAASYPENTTVPVFYDTQKPEDAVLVQGGGGAVGRILGGVGMILAGLVLGFLMTL
jgi:hypothetical protein